MGGFFTLAVVFAITRIIVRVYRCRRVHIDDYLFYLALGVYVGSTCMLFYMAPFEFLASRISSGQAPLPQDAGQFSLSIPAINMAITYDTVLWVSLLSIRWAVFAPRLMQNQITISSIKFSFLFFSYPLVEKLPLRMWWRIVFVICVPVSCGLLIGIHMICPHSGLEVLSMVLPLSRPWN